MDDSFTAKKLIMSSATKSCRLDPIPTWLLKENLDHVLPLLTSIVNQSLSTGTFPKGAHSAIIKTTFEETQSGPNELKNYRPVSNLTFLGKLIEKAACTQLVHHIESNNLFDSFQSACRSRHSTESALVKVKNDIMFAINSNKVVLLVFLDLSAAFDTIDHQYLYPVYLNEQVLDQQFCPGFSHTFLDGLLKLTLPANCQIPQR